MNSLFIPQAFLQYKLLKDSTTPAKAKVISPSTFGKKPLQKIVPLAKIVGPYKPSCAVSKVSQPMSSGPGKGFKISDFLNIENHKLSLLVPELRLYRVIGNSLKPFYFPVTTDYNFTADGNIDLTKPFSANSAVIKSFAVNYVGNNPYAAGLGMLESSIEIEVDSLSTLFYTPDDSYAQLADVMLMRVPESKRMRNNKTPGTGALKSGRSIQVVASLGYSYVDGDNILTAAERDAIDATKVFINLFYKDHNISLQQNGSATISVQYHGNLEAAADDYMFNVVSRPETKKKVLKESTKAKSNVSGKDKGSGPVKGKDIRKDTPGSKAREEENDKKESKPKKLNHLESIVGEVSRIIEELHKKGKIYPVVVDDKSKGFFQFDHKIAKVKGNITQAKAARGKNEAGENELKFSDSLVSSNNPFSIFTKKYTFYVNFADLIDAFLAKISEKDLNEMKKQIKEETKGKKITEEEEQAMLLELQKGEKFLKKMNVLFADLEINPKSTKQPIGINIADIPVSLDLVYTLINEDFIKPKKYFFGLKEFLVQFCLTLANKSLQTYSGAAVVDRAKIKVVSISGVNLSSKIKDGEINVNLMDTSHQALLAATEKNRVNYIIFHQERCETTSSPGKGKLSADEEEGILHLRTSQDRGLIKSIAFQGMSVPGRPEYAAVGHGDSFDALRRPQNATVTMFGNNLFYPSMEVYVDPVALGLGDPSPGLDAAARRIGIGGYYNILQISTTYANGSLTTVLNLSHSGYPETRSEPKRTAGAIKGAKQVASIMKAARNLKKK